MAFDFGFDRSKPFYPAVVTYLLALAKIDEAPEGGDWLGRTITLTTTTTALPVEFLPDEMVAELRAEASYRADRVVPAAAGSLLVAAYEAVVDHGCSGPLWQFLRHCRNGAAHNGRFHFRPGQPDKPAEWRNHTISAQLHGTPVMIRSDGNGLLGLADPLLLPHDVELAFPNLHV